MCKSKLACRYTKTCLQVFTVTFQNPEITQGSLSHHGQSNCGSSSAIRNGTPFSNKWNSRHTQHRGWLSDTLRWVEEVRSKRLHTTHVILEQIRGCQVLSIRAGWTWGMFWDDGLTVLYFNCGNSYMTKCCCESSQVYTLKRMKFTMVKYTSIFKKSLKR